MPLAELTSLERKIAHMAGLTEGLLWRSFDALERTDPTMVDAVARTAHEIDLLEMRLRETIVAMMSDSTLSHDELRRLIAAVQIIGELERVSALARNSAQRSVHVEMKGALARRMLSGMRHLTRLAAYQLKNVLDALALHDDGKALEVWRSDEHLDALYRSVHGDIVVRMIEDRSEIERCSHLLMCAKNLERIGDHATNIAEKTHFLVTGRLLDRHRARHRSFPEAKTIE